MHRPAHQPSLPHRHEPSHDERAATERAEHTGAEVRPHPVPQLVDEVPEDEHVAVAAAHLKEPLDHGLPPEKHLSLGVGQVGAGGHKLLHHGLAVPQPVLQHEVVENGDQPAISRGREVDARSGHHLVQLTGVTGLTGELEELALQVTAALHQIDGQVRTSALVTSTVKSTLGARIELLVHPIVDTQNASPSIRRSSSS